MRFAVVLSSFLLISCSGVAPAITPTQSPHDIRPAGDIVREIARDADAILGAAVAT